MKRQRTRRGLGGSAIAVVMVLTLAACHSTPAATSIHIDLNCVYNGVPGPEPVPDQPGSITVTADSPRWATEGSVIPVVRNSTYTDVDLPISGEVFAFLDVEGGTWNGRIVNNLPALDPATDATVDITESAPGHVTIGIAEVWVVKFVVNRPVSFMCTPTSTPLALADVQVRKNPS